MDGNGSRVPYLGFDKRNFMVPGVSNPPRLPPGRRWVGMNSEITRDFKPMRATRIIIPVSMWARDATEFCQWAAPAGAHARAYATASLVSMQFAGTHQGIRSGNHSDRSRGENDDEDDSGGAPGSGAGAKKKSDSNKKPVNRYVFMSPHNPDEDWPMWLMGYEEIYNAAKTEVTFIGVWQWVFDPTFSTTKIIAQVIESNRLLRDSQCAGAQTATMRHKPSLTEAERNKKGGCSISDLKTNFEGTVGLQYKRICSTSDWILYLNEHAGPTATHGPGKPFVPDLDAHMANAYGERELFGDSTGLGSLHPASFEFACNAKTRDGLAFGSTNIDGTAGDICAEQLDPDSYWDGDHFRLPQLNIPGDGAGSHRTHFWICSSRDRKTIFEMPLPRPIQMAVVPGPSLMQLFLEHEHGIRTANAAIRAAAAASAAAANEAMADGLDNNADDDDGSDDDEEEAPEPPPNELRIDHDAHSRFRSWITRQDERQRAANQELLGTLRRFDLMSDSAMAAISNSNNSVEFDSKDSTYRVCTKKITDKIGEESTFCWSSLVQPWYTKASRELEARINEVECEEDVCDDDPRWVNFGIEKIELSKRFYNIKADLARYHLGCTLQCFMVQRDLATIPNGYKKMVEALMKGVERNGGTASIAFGARGKQLVSNDRTTWHELQEWLGELFVRDCKIDGRDRRIMDELYLQSFEMYTDTTFVLVVCSERGKGKSIRAMRLEKILPDGFVSWQGAASARAGMNGNMSPSNGTLIIFDEMTKDLTGHEADERMEYWKQVLTRRQYVIERTVAKKNTDGTDAHVTCEIVTDHSVSIAICTNLGATFTTGKEEATESKKAMVSRTVSMMARSETDKDSQDTTFREGLERPDVKARVHDFQLFTSIVAFCRLAIRKCGWLQPDLGLAQMLWADGDNMLANEYSQATPEPRRRIRRSENCITCALMESVARVYLYKQTAVNFDAGRPLEGTCKGKPFEIGDLWDVLRIAMEPSRAVIFASWQQALNYSIGTSEQGVNVMTSICEKVGLGIGNIFSKIPKGTVESLVGNMDAHQVLDPMLGDEGASQKDLEEFMKRMGKARKLRAGFRIESSKGDIKQKSPLEAIEMVVGAERKKMYSAALMPTYLTAVAHYKPLHILSWAQGRGVDTIEHPERHLPYKLKESGNGPQLYDHSWLVARAAPNIGEGISYVPLASDLASIKCPVQLFDIHKAGAADVCLLLEDAGNARWCPEMPINNHTQTAQMAFIDEKDFRVSKESKQCFMRPFSSSCGAHELGNDIAVDCRDEDDDNHHTKTPIHKVLDLLVQRGRMPALQAHTSTRMVHCAPLRRVEGSGIEVNTVCAYEHTTMVLESIVYCSTIPGLKGRQEKFSKMRTAPECLRSQRSGAPATFRAPALAPVVVAQGAAGPSNAASLGFQDDPGSPGAVRRRPTAAAELVAPADAELENTWILPYSNDIVQIRWAADFASRLYHPTKLKKLEMFNDFITAHPELGAHMTEEEMVQQPLRFSGYADGCPEDATSDRPAIRFLSVPLAAEKSVVEIEISEASPLMRLPVEVLRIQAAVALGKFPTDAECENYRNDLLGDAQVWGCSGDIHSFETWQDHTFASALNRGNALPVDDQGIGCLLDAETMLDARLLERLAQDEKRPEHKYGIGNTMPMTYESDKRREALPPATFGPKKKSKRPASMMTTGSQLANKALRAEIAAMEKARELQQKRGASSSSAMDIDCRDED